MTQIKLSYTCLHEFRDVETSMIESKKGINLLFVERVIQIRLPICDPRSRSMLITTFFSLVSRAPLSCMKMCIAGVCECCGDIYYIYQIVPEKVGKKLKSHYDSRLIHMLTAGCYLCSRLLSSYRSAERCLQKLSGTRLIVLTAGCYPCSRLLTLQ